jgi:chromosome segregation ATPase
MNVSPIKQAKELMDPRPELSPARQALANARKVRAAASSILETASAAQQRAERLLAAPAPLKARLAELERSAAGIVEAWARGGTGGSPMLPGGDELDGLRRDINEVERVAEAARAAIPALAKDIAAAQSSAQAAVDHMREAAAAILVEEADAKVAELIETERRAATLRGHLRALQHHFQLDAMRGNRGVAGFQDLIRKKVPERIGPTEPEMQRIATRWTAYAERLLADETATSNL